jgi:hypothetical protein
MSFVVHCTSWFDGSYITKDAISKYQSDKIKNQQKSCLTQTTKIDTNIISDTTVSCFHGYLKIHNWSVYSR